MTYPVPEKRKYKHLVPYRGYFVGCYIDTEKALLDVISPTHQIFFPVDEFGDTIMPVDVPFWSPVLCAAAIDMHIMLGADKSVYGKTGGPWQVMHQNYQMQRFLPAIAQALRDVHMICNDPKLDVRYMDAEDLAEAVNAKLAVLWQQLDSAGPLRAGLGEATFDGVPDALGG